VLEPPVMSITIGSGALATSTAEEGPKYEADGAESYPSAAGLAGMSSGLILGEGSKGESKGPFPMMSPVGAVP